MNSFFGNHLPFEELRGGLFARLFPEGLPVVLGAFFSPPFEFDFGIIIYFICFLQFTIDFRQ